MSANNSGHLVGFIAKEPEPPKGGKGPHIVRIGVESSGNTFNDTGYFNLAIFGDRWEKLIPHLKPGRRVVVEYSIKHSTWQTQEGQPRSNYELIASDIRFIRMQEKPKEGQKELEVEAGAESGGSPDFTF
jgi:single-strand DNA-binding protein